MRTEYNPNYVMYLKIPDQIVFLPVQNITTSTTSSHSIVNINGRAAIICTYLISD